jgi:hypothetical protein
VREGKPEHAVKGQGDKALPGFRVSSSGFPGVNAGLYGSAQVRLGSGTRSSNPASSSGESDANPRSSISSFPPVRSTWNGLGDFTLADFGGIEPKAGDLYCRMQGEGESWEHRETFRVVCRMFFKGRTGLVAEPIDHWNVREDLFRALKAK